MLLRNFILFSDKCNSRNQNKNYHDRISKQNKSLHVCKNNLLNLIFQWFYKRFTYPLQLFTIKKLQDTRRPISLLYCFTESITVMNSYNIVFLLLFQYTFVSYLDLFQKTFQKYYLYHMHYEYHNSDALLKSQYVYYNSERVSMYIIIMMLSSI